LRIYVCYGTFRPAPRPNGHPCGRAYHALVDAGYKPDVIRAYGLGGLPDAINARFPGRAEVKRLTGNMWVPVMVTDDGTVVEGSQEIVDWAQANPASAALAAA
jgi:hypothetical protein